tara:strand:+ start:88 stop:342 length:255 start_codon:yes stop_codon:yes gene_type:complete
MKKERKRARTQKGQYVGDDPRTKDIDEAWEPVEDAAEQEDKEIFSGAYTKQKPPKYETVGKNVTQRMSSYFGWLRKKFSGDSSK